MMPLRAVDWIRATGHPLRRRVLRRLSTDERPRSSVELSLELSEPLSSVAYHLRVLQLCGAAKPVVHPLSIRSRAGRYQAAVSGDQWVAAQLAATEAKDEAASRRPVDKRPRRAI